jgi:hypothetical protein
MTVRFATADFLGSNYSERLTACRQMAEQALKFASSASSTKQREIYLELVRQWDKLAYEIERAMEVDKSSALFS